MRRRDLLSVLAGAGVTGLAGCLGGGSGGSGSTTTEADSGESTDTADGTGQTGDLPLVVDTIEAQGSTAGEVRVPVEGTPTVLDLFATWCAPCVAQMESLRSLHDEFGDDVAFVSVTNERLGGGLTMDDIKNWWSEHDGSWTVGHDPESQLMRAVRANGLPYLVVFDADGSISWTHRGLASEENLRAAIEDVR
ncbi:TlpA family protein disulfide reductase [Haloferax mediterranei ATCC 33500]|uniref:Thioredoxin n=1 Tax=Haloferax mediterranei (strain ATCC 33500 / DSM 1411 / JCM 8866 / NBRC 14739 / NCIMB 2177 / R-4) TaxID=523841 RepID=I3R404_HALMT|nr:TlpA disulfide reductase family protein [Haloferax mediterranei]AFK18964.1 thioredoxin [Haloferax mediterranei ATCC 33500]AHZ21674.1 thioredoxin [Haloferax mediterranei ATCC 33500]EMA03177.1 thioredoxin [Haloferax mediterranei ATCC 33500]MDX5989056.1 TlpA disulfide reductase family protein [Haloferax mediterranei ATCC 33500]QCQ75448.1 TlpA family protein disulfide reductase [Haloferax mediterranei ATCC 33500]